MGSGEPAGEGEASHSSDPENEDDEHKEPTRGGPGFTPPPSPHGPTRVRSSSHGRYNLNGREKGDFKEDAGIPVRGHVPVPVPLMRRCRRSTERSVAPRRRPTPRSPVQKMDRGASGGSRSRPRAGNRPSRSQVRNQ